MAITALVAVPIVCLCGGTGGPRTTTAENRGWELAFTDRVVLRNALPGGDMPAMHVPHNLDRPSHHPMLLVSVQHLQEEYVSIGPQGAPRQQ